MEGSNEPYQCDNERRASIRNHQGTIICLLLFINVCAQLYGHSFVATILAVYEYSLINCILIQAEDWYSVTMADLKQIGFPSAATRTQLADLLVEKYPDHTWNNILLFRGKMAQQKRLEKAVASLFPVYPFVTIFFLNVRLIIILCISLSLFLLFMSISLCCRNSRLKEMCVRRQT